jgi:hypothetical protein
MRCSRIYERALLLECSQASPVCPSGKNNEDECGASVELYRQGKTEILGKKPVPMPLCLP